MPTQATWPFGAAYGNVVGVCVCVWATRVDTKAKRLFPLFIFAVLPLTTDAPSEEGQRLCRGERGTEQSKAKGLSSSSSFSLPRPSQGRRNSLVHTSHDNNNGERERETGCWVAARSFFGGERDEQCCAARNTLQGKLSFLLHFPFLFP